MSDSWGGPPPPMHESHLPPIVEVDGQPWGGIRKIDITTDMDGQRALEALHDVQHYMTATSNPNPYDQGYDYDWRPKDVDLTVTKDPWEEWIVTSWQTAVQGRFPQCVRNITITWRRGRPRPGDDVTRNRGLKCSSVQVGFTKHDGDNPWGDFLSATQECLRLLKEKLPMEDKPSVNITVLTEDDLAKAVPIYPPIKVG